MSEKEGKNKSRTIIIAIAILATIYLFTFVVFRPFDNMPTYDKPIIKKLCDMQLGCEVVNGPVSCYHYEYGYFDSRWSSAKDYNGCNESSNGYLMEDKIGYVIIEICSCGGLM